MVSVRKARKKLNSWIRYYDRVYGYGRHSDRCWTISYQWVWMRLFMASQHAQDRRDLRERAIPMAPPWVPPDEYSRGRPWRRHQ